MICPLASIEEEIKTVAPMASLSLALLGFFTNLRFGALKTFLDGAIDSFGWGTVAGLLPDLCLALFTAAAVLVMAPLSFDAFSFGDIGERSATVSTMFFLIWLGFVALLVLQLTMAGVRLFKAITAGS